MSIEIPSVWKHRQCPSVPFSARVPALFARQCGNNASKSAGEENRHFLIRERDAVGRVGEQVSSQVAIDISTSSPPLASGGGRHRDQSSCPSANTNNASAYVNYASIVNNHLNVNSSKT